MVCALLVPTLGTYLDKSPCVLGTPDYLLCLTSLTHWAETGLSFMGKEKQTATFHTDLLYLQREAALSPHSNKET